VDETDETAERNLAAKKKQELKAKVAPRADEAMKRHIERRNKKAGPRVPEVETSAASAPQHPTAVNHYRVFGAMPSDMPMPSLPTTVLNVDAPAFPSPHSVHKGAARGRAGALNSSPGAAAGPGAHMGAMSMSFSGPTGAASSSPLATSPTRGKGAAQAGGGMGGMGGLAKNLLNKGMSLFKGGQQGDGEVETSAGSLLGPMRQGGVTGHLPMLPGAPGAAAAAAAGMGMGARAAPPLLALPTGNGKSSFSGHSPGPLMSSPSPQPQGRSSGGGRGAGLVDLSGASMASPLGAGSPAAAAGAGRPPYRRHRRASLDSSVPNGAERLQVVVEFPQREGGGGGGAGGAPYLAAGPGPLPLSRKTPPQPSPLSSSFSSSSGQGGGTATPPPGLGVGSFTVDPYSPSPLGTSPVRGGASRFQPDASASSKQNMVSPGAGVFGGGIGGMFGGAGGALPQVAPGAGAAGVGRSAASVTGGGASPTRRGGAPIQRAGPGLVARSTQSVTDRTGLTLGGAGMGLGAGLGGEGLGGVPPAKSANDANARRPM
jgi:hypothetical protein